MRMPIKSIGELDQLSPFLTSRGLHTLSTEGCHLPSVEATRARYYRLDIFADLWASFEYRDDAVVDLIRLCNEYPNARWWFQPRDTVRSFLMDMAVTRLTSQG
jgi:hypothetical protein